MARRITTDIFISESSILHNYKYDYTKTKYIKSLQKVIIICKEHGEFKQLANNHLNNKQGCPKCAKNSKVSFDTFLKKANQIYKTLYSYDKKSFINYKTKIKIKCEDHGEFYKTPSDHIYLRQGCPKCSKKYRKTTKDFIKLSMFIHGEYAYTKSEYVANNKYVIITCLKHGDFKQYPKAHLVGQGCPKCKCSKGETEISKILNYNNIQYEKEYTNVECYSKRLLRFDFFIKDLNLLIEFDGIQHFEEVPFFGKESFNMTIKNDKIKNDFAHKNKIKLLRIKYNDDVYKVLKKEIKWLEKLETKEKRN